MNCLSLPSIRIHSQFLVRSVLQFFFLVPLFCFSFYLSSFCVSGTPIHDSPSVFSNMFANVYKKNSQRNFQNHVHIHALSRWHLLTITKRLVSLQFCVFALFCGVLVWIVRLILQHYIWSFVRYLDSVEICFANFERRYKILFSFNHSSTQRCTLECMWFELKTKFQSILININYRSVRQAPAYYWQYFDFMLKRALDENCNIICLGDLNLNFMANIFLQILGILFSSMVLLTLLINHHIFIIVLVIFLYLIQF
jgi:hypothetical protein